MLNALEGGKGQIPERGHLGEKGNLVVREESRVSVGLTVVCFCNPRTATARGCDLALYVFCMSEEFITCFV